MNFNLELSTLTIDEILSPVYEPVPAGEADAKVAQQRLMRWREISADNDEFAFAERLKRHNLTEASVLARLADVRRRQEHKAPAWVADTWRTIELLKCGASSAAHNSGAFGSLLAPVLDDAIARLRGSLEPDALSQLHPGAFDNIVDHLRQRLCNLCELPLYECLLRWRSLRLSEARGGNKHAEQQLLAETIKPFALYLRSGGYDQLVRLRPMLFRLITMLVSHAAVTMAS